MSEVHVHGVVPSGGTAPGGARRIAHGDVAALVSDVDPERLTAAGVLREHWRVLEEAGAATAVLPVRFGTVMAGDQVVVDEFLAPGHDGLAAALAELEGKVQLTVKGYYDEDALMRSVVEASPGVARLRERVRTLPEAAAYYDKIELGRLVSAEVERAREHDTALVLERLEPLAVATNREPPSTLSSAVDAAFLVQRERVDEFSRAVAALGRELEGRMQLRYVGPTPAYSFAGGEEVAAWA